MIRVMEGICRLYNRWEEHEMIREDSYEEEHLFDLGLQEMSELTKKVGGKYSKWMAG